MEESVFNWIDGLKGEITVKDITANFEIEREHAETIYRRYLCMEKPKVKSPETHRKAESWMDLKSSSLEVHQLYSENFIQQNFEDKVEQPQSNEHDSDDEPIQIVKSTEKHEKPPEKSKRRKKVTKAHSFFLQPSFVFFFHGCKICC